jgi:hypothetical protein
MIAMDGNRFKGCVGVEERSAVDPRRPESLVNHAG